LSKEKYEDKVITTIYIPANLKKWILEHGYKLSTFFREAVEEKIEKESGYKVHIERKQKEIEELEKRLKIAKTQLESFKKLDKEFQEKSSAKTDEGIIETAILKVKYRDSVECARDLMELKPEDMNWLDWLKKIDKKRKELLERK